MNDRTENVKQAFFKPFDLIIYLIIAVIIALSLAFAAPKNVGVLEASVRGAVVFAYDFSNKTYSVLDGQIVTVLSDTEFRISVGDGYNVVTIDAQNNDAYVSDSDCAGGECKKMKASLGSIICAPHGLVVSFKGASSEPKVG